jgi:hypothetical protein
LVTISGSRATVLDEPILNRRFRRDPERLKTRRFGSGLCKWLQLPQNVIGIKLRLDGDSAREKTCIDPRRARLRMFLRKAHADPAMSRDPLERCVWYEAAFVTRYRQPRAHSAGEAKLVQLG